MAKKKVTAPESFGLPAEKKMTTKQKLSALSDAAKAAKEIETSLPGRQDEILGGIIQAQKPLDRLQEKYPLTEMPATKKTGETQPTERTYTAPDGTTFTDQLAFATYVADLRQQKFDEANKLGERKSAFSILKEEFDRYGLGDLVGDVEQLAKEGLSAAEYSLELRKKPSYTQRFSANQQRINSGLRALSEAEYVNLEDQYQQVMRQYGLPQSFYSTGKTGRQPELEKFIAGDVSPVELEDRVQTAVERVKNAAPEVIQALTTYYGGPGGITESNLVAYVLDPQRALPEIKRKVAAAEIGAAGRVAGFGVTGTRAEELAMRGVTQAQAQQGYQTAAELLPRAEQLSSIYGAEKYDQTAAEQEIFGLEGAASARRKRQKLAGMEQAQFGARTGMAGSALERGRSGAF